MLLTGCGQFMTEPRYPELVAGPEELAQDEVISSLEDGAVLSATQARVWPWSEVDDDEYLLFASGQSRYLPGKLRELLKLTARPTPHVDKPGSMAG